MFKISVKLEGIERRKRSTGLLHIVAGFFLVLSTGSYYSHTSGASLNLMVPVYIVALISLGYGALRKKLDPPARYNHWIRVLQFLTFAFLAISLGPLISTLRLLSIVLWAIVILFLMFTERKMFEDTDLQIKEEGVFVPGYFRSHVIPWQLMEAFVLRPDFLTITRKDQKYVQLELLKGLTASEIQAINSFCQNQISGPSVSSI
jgi:small-conductance mechanosensitive channel